MIQTFQRVEVVAVACIDAPEIVSSESIESRFADTLGRIGSRPGLIEALTGVKTRRFFSAETPPSKAATQAAEKAIEESGLDPSAIDVIINTSVCKDFIEPSVASLVHRNLGLKRACINFDVGNACLAFLDAMALVSMMIDAGTVRYGLIVDGENSRFVVDQTIERLRRPDATASDLRDHFATLTLGSGAAAMILGPSEQPGRRIHGRVSLSATEHNDLCRGHADQMITDAQGLLKAGVALAVETYGIAQRSFGWSEDVLDHLILHQVGSVHTKTLLRALHLPHDKAPLIYPEHGNIGPAAIPIALAKSLEQGRISSGDRLALMGIGSGLNVSMLELVW